MSNPVLTEEDLRLLVAGGCHLGAENLSEDMKPYVYKKAASGAHIIDLQKTWEKINMAARVLVTVHDPTDVVVISSRTFGQRASYKFSQYTGAQSIGSARFTPGTFTNQTEKRFMQPRVVIVTDPRSDHQPRNETAYSNIPVIALADTDSPLEYCDIVIPCNNKGKHSLAVIYWLLARQVLRMRGAIMPNQPWDVAVDLFIYRDPEEVENKIKEERSQAKYVESPAASGDVDNWGNEGAAQADGFGDWAAEGAAPVAAEGAVAEDWGASW